MGHVVMLFDRCIRATPEHSRAEILSRVRTVAIGNGCNNVQKAVVVQAAELWLDQAMRVEEVIQRARAKAKQLVASSHGPSGPEAA